MAEIELTLIIHFIQWEILYPAECKIIFVYSKIFISDICPQSSEGCDHDSIGVSNEQHGITFSRSCLGFDDFRLFRTEKFSDRAFHSLSIEADIGESFRFILLHFFSKFISLFSAQYLILKPHRFDSSSIRHGIFEHGKA